MTLKHAFLHPKSAVCLNKFWNLISCLTENIASPLNKRSHYCCLRKYAIYCKNHTKRIKYVIKIIKVFNVKAGCKYGHRCTVRDKPHYCAHAVLIYRSTASVILPYETETSTRGWSAFNKTLGQIIYMWHQSHNNKIPTAINNKQQDQKCILNISVVSVPHCTKLTHLNSLNVHVASGFNIKTIGRYPSTSQQL